MAVADLGRASFDGTIKLEEQLPNERCTDGQMKPTDASGMVCREGCESEDMSGQEPPMPFRFRREAGNPACVWRGRKWWVKRRLARP